TTTCARNCAPGSSGRATGCSAREAGAGSAPGGRRDRSRPTYPRRVRVIAGVAKGVRLGPVPAGVRPLSDRAREGLFASLGTRVVGATVLDLFAGTGAIGIEALSRGADMAVLVERDRTVVRTLASNLER